MIIIDGDYPMAYGATDLGRDLTRPLAEVRAAGTNPDNIPFCCYLRCGLARSLSRWLRWWGELRVPVTLFLAMPAVMLPTLPPRVTWRTIGSWRNAARRTS